MFLPYFRWINNKNYFGPPHSPRPTFTDILYHCTQFVHSYTLPYNLTLPTQTCGAHTMLGSVVLLYIYTVVQSLYTCAVEPVNLC